MKKITLGIMAAVLSTIIYAQPIDFQTGSLPTGGNTKLGKIATDELEKQGLVVNYKATGNCSLIKTTWNNTKEPLLVLWSSTFNLKNSPCRIPFEPKEIIAVLYEFPMAMCSLKNQTLEDYLRPGSRHLVGAPGNKFDGNLFEVIEKTHNIKHTVIDYRNVTEMQSAGKSGEIDWVFMSQPSAEQLGARCIWNTARDQAKGIKQAKALWPTATSNVLYYTVWIAGKNIDSKTESKIKAGLQSSAESTVWKDFATSRGYLGFTLNRQQIAIKTDDVR